MNLLWIRHPAGYLRAMPGKPIELPPAVSRAFVEDMRAFLVERNSIRRDEIAARQLYALKQHYSRKLRLLDVKEMFQEMREHLGDSG
jgi:hypothetical protein